MTRIQRLLPYGVFLLPLAAFGPFLGSFAYAGESKFTDLAVSHVPYALYLQRWLAQGVIPLWSEALFSGAPFAANPLSSLFYPPHWLALLFSMPFGLNLMAVLHLTWGGLGMYRLLRRLGADRAPALLGGLTFCILPKLTVLIGAGHLTLLYAMAWTPWLLACAVKRETIGSAAVLGMIALADPRWAVPAGCVWALVGGWNALQVAGKERWERLTRLIAAGAWGIALAAPLLVPLFALTRTTTRQAIPPQDILLYSLPPERLAGLVLPDIGTLPEWLFYPGALAFGLGLTALFYRPARERCVGWLLLALAGMVIALGSSLPGAEFVAKLPVINLLRVPARMLFWTGFGLCVTAGLTLDEILKNRSWGRSLPKMNMYPLLAGLGGMAGGLSLAVKFTGGNLPPGFVWGTAAIWMGFALLIWLRQETLRPAVWIAAATLFTVIDLLGVGLLSLRFEPAQKPFGEGEAVAQAAIAQNGGKSFRVYSPTFSLPQQTAARYALELANGVDPLQLQTYVQWFSAASGVEAQGYSVTLPAIGEEEINEANRDAKPDAYRLGLLSVTLVASEYPLTTEGLEFSGKAGQTYLYQNRLAMPRAWVQDAEEAAGKGPIRAVESRVLPNQVIIETVEGPGLLVTSEVMAPGWDLRVDNKNQPVTVVDGLLRGAILPDGVHRVVFSYQPVSIPIGLGVGLAGWVAAGAFAWKRRRGNGGAG